MDQAEQEEFIQRFGTWSGHDQVELIEKLLGKMAHHQHSQIDAALQPFLQRDFITILPQRGLSHVSERILSYLDAKSLFMASCVCREWRRIIKEGFLWKKLIEKRVEADRLWAGLVRRRGWDKDLFKPPQDYDYSKHQRLYYNIVADIKNLEKRWHDGEYNTQRIHCHSENSKGVYCIQYDDEKIVSGLRDNTIKVWDRKTLKCTRTFQGHSGSVLCLQYDDRVIVSGSSDATVRVWDIHDLTKSQPLNTVIQHTEAVLHLKFNKNMMVTCSKDRTIIVWEIVSAEDVRVRQILVGHRAAVNVVDFDEKYIVSASGDRTIKVWNTSTYDFVKTLNGHRRGIACLQYRDKLIVSGSSDNSIKIWDIESGTCLRTLEGHEELVRCIRFDNRRIVSGAYDGKIKVWDLRAALDDTSPDSALCSKTLQMHTGRVFRLQFDEFQIVSSSHDDTIIIWDFLNPEPIMPIPLSSSMEVNSSMTNSNTSSSNSNSGSPMNICP